MHRIITICKTKLLVFRRLICVVHQDQEKKFKEGLGQAVVYYQV